MQNIENLDVFEILITQKLLKCPKDPFVRSALKLFYLYIVCFAKLPSYCDCFTFFSRIHIWDQSRSCRKKGGDQPRITSYMSLVVRKPTFCICENKDADQLRGNREADQRLCFRYTDSTIPLFPKSEISSLWPSSVAVQPGLCRTWSKTPKTGFLTTRLI